LVLGVIDVLQSMQQEVIHRLDVFAEEAHDRPLLGKVMISKTIDRARGSLGRH
jgi:hypothetical protein